MSSKYYNFVAYTDAIGRSKVGHLELDSNTIIPLSFASGTAVSSVYEIIETNSTFSLVPSTFESRIPLDLVNLSAPFTGRDILAVGKNYYDHAKEFNSSGFDSSDKVDIPSHPVIFTKRFSSIVPSGAEIYAHPEFTHTLDFEGEVGVVIGKPAYRVDEEHAMDYVWGYTIINDATARERQRDHKQFFIGKSADTLCPMGPITVPKEYLPEYLQLRTTVNGQQRQSDSTKNLIFSIPTLIKVLSSGMTLQPGDVIATGTPAGVGIGLNPPVYLKPGDLVEISVTGLGTLSNKVSELAAAKKPVLHGRTPTLVTPDLFKIGSKYLYFEDMGRQDAQYTVVCVHGLGCTGQYFSGLVDAAGFLDKYRVILLDLEGFGRSLTFPESKPSIQSYAEDVYGIITNLGITKNVYMIGFSMGCGITEIFAAIYPEIVSKIVLLAPLQYPSPPAVAKMTLDMAAEVRKYGMQAVGNRMVAISTAEESRARDPLIGMYIRTMLKMTNIEGFAKGCQALASEITIPRDKIIAATLVVTGSEDQWPPIEEVRQVISNYTKTEPELAVIAGSGHFHLLEQFQATVDVVAGFL
ncbi:fumarylacetoacetate hydrolase [Lipomyces oligophaga]|uniref:fumarylacetoacetate hydrolase n=1 Tax=Lipomyces oligophaga TaxID=45792 RepID=UPI0034D014EA